MKRLLSVLTIIGAFLCHILAVRTAAQNTSENELRVLIADRRNASIDGNAEKIASSMADSYLQTDISGYVQDKSAWLREYFNPLADLIKAGGSAGRSTTKKTSIFIYTEIQP